MMRITNLVKYAALAGLMCLTLAAPSHAADEQAAATVNEDGMYTQDWFLESFLELREDLDESAGEGKRFAILWEQRGCPYCRETHLVNFAVPEIHNFVKDGFNVVQLNIHGTREVTDFDGQKMSEAELATKYGVRYTPTVTFYHEKPGASGASGTPGTSKKITWETAELSRMTGYYKPFHFLAVFKYVREKAYKGQKFGPYVAAIQARRIKAGKPVKFR